MGGGALWEPITIRQLVVLKTQNLGAETRDTATPAKTHHATVAQLSNKTAAKAASHRAYMQIFANLLRWLAGSGARRAHVKRADDLLKKLSRSLSSK
jgi:hypothetical protein